MLIQIQKLMSPFIDSMVSPREAERVESARFALRTVPAPAPVPDFDEEPVAPHGRAASARGPGSGDPASACRRSA